MHYNVARAIQIHVDSGRRVKCHIWIDGVEWTGAIVSVIDSPSVNVSINVVHCLLGLVPINVIDSRKKRKLTRRLDIDGDKCGG